MVLAEHIQRGGTSSKACKPEKGTLLVWWLIQGLLYVKCPLYGHYSELTRSPVWVFRRVLGDVVQLSGFKNLGFKINQIRYWLCLGSSRSKPWMLTLYLGGDTGQSGRGEGMWNREGKKANEKCFIKHIPFVGKWSLIPLRNSRSQYWTPTSESFHLR